MQSVSADVVIVGGGVAGLATAYYLSQNSDLKIILLEKDDIPNPHNSSYGDERMYRRMYSDEYLSELQEQSLIEWKLLESKHQCQLLRQNGLLFYGESWDEETIEGSIPGARRVMEKKGIPFEALNAEQMRSRWPCNPNLISLGYLKAPLGWSGQLRPLSCCGPRRSPKASQFIQVKPRFIWMFRVASACR